MISQHIISVAIAVQVALGGSTNGVLHVLAMAAEAGSPTAPNSRFRNPLVGLSSVIQAMAVITCSQRTANSDQCRRMVASIWRSPSTGRRAICPRPRSSAAISTGTARLRKPRRACPLPPSVAPWNAPTRHPGEAVCARLVGGARAEPGVPAQGQGRAAARLRLGPCPTTRTVTCPVSRASTPTSRFSPAQG